MNELAILIVLLILTAIIVRVDFIVYVAYVLIAVYGWSRWIVPRSLRKLAARRDFHRRAFLGEPVHVQVTLINRGQLPILWLQVVESVPPELRSGASANRVIHLGRKKQRQLEYQVRAMKRGYYRLGPLQMAAGDMFGFQERESTLEPDYLTVYPRIVPLTKLNLPSRLPFGTLPSKQRLFDDPARPHGVRDYRMGDSLRFVNWKVSAHSGTLLVRTHQPAISLETTLLLNLNSTEYSRRLRLDGPEWAIVVAASLASHLVNQRQAVGLISNGVDPLLQQQLSSAKKPAFDEPSGRLTLGELPDDMTTGDQTRDSETYALSDPIPPRPGRDHLMQILERLARLEAAPTVRFDQYAYRACLNLNWGITIMAIVPDLQEASRGTLHRLVRAGFNVVTLVIEPYADFASVREQARALGFAAYHVANSQDLRRWQEETHHGQ